MTSLAATLWDAAFDCPYSSDCEVVVVRIALFLLQIVRALAHQRDVSLAVAGAR